MAVLSWGKPTVRYSLLDSAGNPTTWKVMPPIVEDTTQLEIEEGTVTDATEEGGGIIDSRTTKNKYSATMAIFMKDSDTEQPIADDDGVIAGNYALELIGEDPKTWGFEFAKATVSATHTYTAGEGSRVVYKFRAMIPSAGVPAFKWKKGGLGLTPSSLQFTSAEDSTGQTVAVSGGTGTVTASSSAGWATASVSGTTVTITVTANAGGARTGTVTITRGALSTTITVNQAAA